MPATKKSAAAHAATTEQPLAPAVDAPEYDLADGRLHPPTGVHATTIGHSGHRHDAPTDCAECAADLRAEGWLTPAQHQAAREAALEAELKRRERARILGLDLPL